MNFFILFIIFTVFGFLDSKKWRPCPGPIPVASNGPEINAAGISPNNKVILTDDGKFKTYKIFGQNGNYDDKMTHCQKFTCGRKTFPHGFNVDIYNGKSLMQCEEHRCVHPDTIKCRKTTEYGACRGLNEWIAGFVERKNETKEWLEVECCHSTENTKPKFVKIIPNELSYNHDYVVVNEKLIGMDYIKTITKVKLGRRATYTLTIYRMTCPSSSFNFTDVPSVYDTDLHDADGTGIFENPTKMCNKETDFHVLHFYYGWEGKKQTNRRCLAQNCLNEKNIVCMKNVKMEDCAEENQWVADLKLRENSTDNELDVECCQYNADSKDNFNPEFAETLNFTDIHVEIDDKVLEFTLTTGFGYINNITVENTIDNGTIYWVSLYKVNCSRSFLSNDPRYTWYSFFDSIASIAKSALEQNALTNSIHASGNNSNIKQKNEELAKKLLEQKNDPILALLGRN